MGEPRYVTAIEPDTATVVLGRRHHLLASRAELSEVSWVAGEAPPPGPVEVQVRYNAPAVSGRLAGTGSPGCTVTFDDPQRAVAPGQAAVLYRDEVVLGGGTISGAFR